MFNLTHNKKNANENYVDTNFHIVVTSISKSNNTLYWEFVEKKRHSQTLLVGVLIDTTPTEVHLAITNKI